ncbi:antitoxin [Alcaligenes faecalis]|uniref:antitoxin n=1 Tax=Alcaligenes faecalis TaxID=511 RepID=UPI001C83D763|nr:AbrB/MazE/SpoVT family DNA-binding domain-containing protein [Alcaligenes faecalis]MBX6962802.1 AbrB/MazE/SpoVT family DNA-binding domain-containing protein [Providencia rettgeri]MBX7032328.1 AbrB/MazE/SpoVT family DNA-binding domain-containing protein [Alcaligenes faecalis]
MRTNVKLPTKKAHPTSKTTSVFMSGNSQAVRLPEGFRFEGKRVFIRRDQVSGDVILSSKPRGWDHFLNVAANTDPAEFEGFIEDLNRDQEPAPQKDPFAGWEE